MDREDRNDLHARYITHYITAVEGKKADKPKHFIALDSEDNTQGVVDIVNFFDGTDHYTFWKEMGDDWLERAVRTLYTVAARRANTVIVAHNLEYDLNNLFRWCNWAFVEEMRYSSRLITAKLEGLKVECWDSFNLCPTSLKAMAKVVGMVKGDWQEASNAGLTENIEYCKQDCVILWTFMDKFQGLCLEKIRTSVRPTIGGLAMRAWRRNFLDRNSLAAHCSDLALRAYYGGRTEAFFIGNVGATTVADVRSMYPTAMKNDYPDCETLEESRLATHRFGVGHFKIRVPHLTHVPPLPQRGDGRLFFPTGDLEGDWTYHEVRYAVEECGCILLQESPGVGTNVGGAFLARYVDEFYALRCNARSAGDKFGLQFYKLLLNNLYGKLAMNRPRTVVAKTCPAIKPGKVLTPVRTLGPFGVWEETSEKPAETTNFLWGAYVTSYARVHLHRLLQGVHDQGHHLLYCDTDSVMFEPCSEERPYEIGEELGMMEEEKYLSGEFITAKGYWLEYKDDDGETCHKVACKGVPNAQAMEFFSSGHAWVRRPVKMREGFVQEILANVWRDVEKTARTTYSKRAVARDGNTRPWRTAQIPTVLKKLKAKESLQ